MMHQPIPIQPGVGRTAAGKRSRTRPPLIVPCCASNSGEPMSMGWTADEVSGASRHYRAGGEMQP